MKYFKTEKVSCKVKQVIFEMKTGQVRDFGMSEGCSAT